MWVVSCQSLDPAQHILDFATCDIGGEQVLPLGFQVPLDQTNRVFPAFECAASVVIDELVGELVEGDGVAPRTFLRGRIAFV